MFRGHILCYFLIPKHKKTSNIHLGGGGGGGATKAKISFSHLGFVSDLVGNPNCWFSHAKSQLFLLQKEASLTDNKKQKAFLYELCLSCCKGDNCIEDVDRVVSPELYRKMWLYRVQEMVDMNEVKFALRKHTHAIH